MGRSTDGKRITPWEGSWAQKMEAERLAGFKEYPRKPRLVAGTFKVTMAPEKGK